MPELPEVEVFKNYIKRTSLHKKIDTVTVHDKRLLKKISVANCKKIVKGHSFGSVERKGKYVLLSLTHTTKKIVMHFGLNGSVEYQKDGEDTPKYAQVSFVFAQGSALFFIDKRKFGGVWLIEDTSAIKGLHGLGVDALKLTAKKYKLLVQENQRKNIKAFLMDQSLIAGIGNEYSDEILFKAGIDPHHRVGDLTATQLSRLCKQIKSVLTFAIKVRASQMKKLKGTAPFSNEDMHGFPATYLQAHRHTDKRCPKNSKHKLKKATIAGRSCYYCPIDQK